MKYSQAEEQLIEEQGQALFAACRGIVKGEADMELIKKAFYFAKDAHEGVRRKSGEPYIVHPIAVARIVLDEIGLGVKSVVASLVHDVVEDTNYTVEDIEHQFGEKIARMVDGLTKIAEVFADTTHATKDETSQQAENFRKMLLTLSDDVRVILIKLADRLHNMRTLGSMPVHKQLKITSETMYLFAPLAHRLGLHSVKTELEDLSLRYRFPDEYQQIEGKLKATDASRNEYIDRFDAPIVQILRENGIDFEISGRVKSVYSIWKKMQKKGIPFEEVYDIFAIRIVFKSTPLIPEKSQCWHIYSLITDIYKPKPDRIRDWVNIPKANGYEALHCTVMGPDGDWVEVQIRSERMEAIAERGFAAHWKYKEEQWSKGEGELDKWIKQIREALNSPTENAVEFLDNFKMNLYTSEVVVFTPKGEQRILPQGATALDFAYEIHSKIGSSAVGAKINHDMVPIFTPIHSGDQIEIITSRSVTPQPEWLEHVVTAKAKTGIKNFLKRDKQNNIENGMAIFETKMREFGIHPSARVFRKLLPAYQSTTKDEFYSKLATGIINLNGVEKILRQNAASKIIKYWTLQFPNPFKSRNNDRKRPSAAPKEEEPEYRYSIAECCNPIPGDQVLGYKDEADHINVHKKSCPVAVRLAAQHGENIVEAKWSGVKEVSYLTHIELRGIDRIGITLDIAKVVSDELRVNMRELKLQSHDGIFEGVVSLYVKSIDDLKDIVARLGKIRGIEHVHRIETIPE
ncbi:MAG: RelA/SpoT family protein [Rikenellaceae bacterium]|jgi:GTP pyrophosphokinase|nr:RelA/SpoT family protein [Rikenellaceae bacterium]